MALTQHRLQQVPCTTRLRHAASAPRVRGAAPGPAPPAPRRTAAAPATAAAAALPPAAALRMASAPWEPFGMAAPDALFDELDQEMAATFRGMDRLMGQSAREVRELQRQVDEDVARALRDLRQQQQRQQQQAGPGVRMEFAEQRGVSSYRCYQSIEIRTGSIAAAVPSQALAPAPGFSPLLAAALLLAAAWAAVGTALARNIHLTSYAARSRLRLAAAWPFLAAFSGRFRAQLAAALRGERYTDKGRGGGSSGGAPDDAAGGGGRRE